MVPDKPLQTVMRWLGKAPRVQILSKRGLEADLLDVGFLVVRQPDVGATATTAFILARMPL